MAASSMRRICRLAVRHKLSKLSCHRLDPAASALPRSQSTDAASDEYTDEAEYPPVKPPYPPGRWGQMDSETAWRWYEKGEELLTKADPRERLESFCGEKDECLHNLQLFDRYPRNINYKKAVTKSIVLDGLPKLYSSIPNVSTASSVLASVVKDNLAQANDAYEYVADKMTVRVQHEDKAYMTHTKLVNILMPLVNLLASKCSYLHRAQVDENVRVTAFWFKGGFDNINVMRKPRNVSHVSFSVDGEAEFQVRTELPLPEFVPMEDALCQSSEVQDIDGYKPGAWGISRKYGQPTSLSGYWIGDPCEFTQLGIYRHGYHYYKMLEEKGSVPPELLTSAGLLSSFTSCVAQAHNQGFGVYHELTYPFTTQTIVTDGQNMQFFSFQLNTLQLWKDADANPLCNILWQSKPMQLYEVIENGEVKGFNEEAFETILKFLLNAPCDRGVNLKPYLPDWDTPGKKKVLINKKGEEPLEMPEIGRWQYPRHSVYFKNCVW